MIQRSHYVVALPFLCWVAVYHDTLSKVVKGWFTLDHSHGLLVFIFAVYLLKDKCDAIYELDKRPSLIWGSLLTITGGCLFLFGKFTGTWTVEGISLIFSILGIILLVMGPAHFKLLLFPIGYLIFMFPFFDELLGGISIYLQNITAGVAAIILTLFGMPVFTTKQFLSLPHINLEVARACNGINHITALLAITIPFSFLVYRSWIKRIVLICSALVIGIFANGLRVALIGLISTYWTGGPLHGPNDIFYVTFTFILGLLLLLLISYLIGQERIEPPVLREKVASKSVIQRENKHTKSVTVAVSVAVCLLLVLGYWAFMCNPVPVYPSKTLNEFPLTIGTYQGQDLAYKDDLFRGFSADYEVMREYKDEKSGKTVRLYIGYLSIQNNRKKITAYPDQDKFKEETDIVEILFENQKYRINRTLFKESGTLKNVYYWYDINGTIVANRNYARIVTGFNGILNTTNNGSIVILSEARDTASIGARGEISEDNIYTFIQVIRDYLTVDQ